jgi:hypothetical protein
MKFSVMAAGAGILVSSLCAVAQASDCDPRVRLQGEVRTYTSNGSTWQTTQLNVTCTGEKPPSTRGQLYFTRFVNGSCSIRSVGHLASTPNGETIRVWLLLNGQEQTLSLSKSYQYSPEYDVSFDCSSLTDVQARFAFVYPDGTWDNNQGQDYSVTLLDPAVRD